MRRLALAPLALTLTLALAHAEDTPSASVPAGVTAESLGKFKVTYYWITCEDDAKGERDTEIVDRKGAPLGKFRADFVKNLKLEGTGRTIEGKTLNWAGAGHFEIVKHPWGTGAKSTPLEPFRSIAVDPKTIPIGTKVLIPEAVGALLPDGSVHDGVFTAADTGGAIKGEHIDLFCGLKRDMKIIQGRGVDSVVIHKVTRDERKPLPPVTFPRTGVVRFAKAIVFKEADPSSETADTLKEGEKVKVVGREGAFWKLGEKRWLEGPTLDLRAAH